MRWGGGVRQQIFYVDPPLLMGLFWTSALGFKSSVTCMDGSHWAKPIEKTNLKRLYMNIGVVH